MGRLTAQAPDEQNRVGVPNSEGGAFAMDKSEESSTAITGWKALVSSFGS